MISLPKISIAFRISRVMGDIRVKSSFRGDGDLTDILSAFLVREGSLEGNFDPRYGRLNLLVVEAGGG